MERNAEAAEVARDLRLSTDSVGRYAREGRIPFETTPGGHRRFNLDEVRQALGLGGGARVFTVPAATVRARAIRSVRTTAGRAAPAAGAAGAAAERSAAGDLIGSAFRLQRSVPLSQG